MPVRSIFLAVLLCFALPAVAQQQPIEARMTPDEFRAAGLDKLDAGELEQLNAWLDRAIDKESEKVAATTRKQVEDQNRGFLSFGSDEPVTGRINGEFRGFARGREFTLDNGQVWRQTDSASLAGARRDAPQVTISPSLVGNAWYMSIKGYNTRAKVERIK